MPMEVGAQGPPVSYLQGFLASQGLSIVVTSRYDDQTRRAVQQLQRMMRPVYDGPIDGLWVGPTRRAACGMFE